MEGIWHDYRSRNLCDGSCGCSAHDADAEISERVGVGLITTVISSLAGGSFIIIKFNLHAWATDVWGMIALGGFFFTCGLRGWAIVRWIFNYIEKKEDSDIFEVATDIKNDLKEFKD